MLESGLLALNARYQSILVSDSQVSLQVEQQAVIQATNNPNT